MFEVSFVEYFVECCFWHSVLRYQIPLELACCLRQKLYKASQMPRECSAIYLHDIFSWHLHQDPFQYISNWKTDELELWMVFEIWRMFYQKAQRISVTWKRWDVVIRLAGFLIKIVMQSVKDFPKIKITS